MKSIKNTVILLCLFSAGASLSDNYWEILLEPSFAHPDKRVEFWRTHESDGTVTVYRACPEDDKTVATAKANPDGSWALSAQFGNLTAKVEKPGLLKFIVSGKPYAMGQRISAFSCTDGVPDRIKPLIPLTRERSFAALTGPAATLEQSGKTTLPTTRTSPVPAIGLVPDTDTKLPNGDDYRCHTTPQASSAIRALEKIPTLGYIPAIYPGALLQGKLFATGSFAPITIPRAPGAISISGINVKTVAADLPMFSGEMVNSLVAKFARQHSLGTESDFSFRTDIIYNPDQLAYSLGVDGRFLNGLDGIIQIDPSSQKNYVLATFQQTYFTASFEDPESKFGVFADDEAFEDDEGQITPDNPPLYVKSVGYGRTIYFLVASMHDAAAVQAALNAAKEGGADAMALSQGVLVPYSKILQESTVSYFIQGGDSIATLGNVGQIKGVANMYEAIKKAIVDAKVAQLTDYSKGLPVNYTLAYLNDRTIPTMGFSTAFNQRGCSTKPKEYASYYLKVVCIDDRVVGTALLPNNQTAPVLDSSGDNAFVQLDLFFPTKEDSITLRLELKNYAGPSCLNFQLIRELNNQISVLDNATGNMVPVNHVLKQGNKWILPSDAPVVKTGGSWSVGWLVDYRIRLNRKTGIVTVVQGR